MAPALDYTGLTFKFLGIPLPLPKEIPSKDARAPHPKPSELSCPTNSVAIRILRTLPSFDCKYKHRMVCLWQHSLIGRLDDAAHFEVKDPQGHPNFDFALRTNVRWSKNVMEERQCPPKKVLVYVFCTCHLLF